MTSIAASRFGSALLCGALIAFVSFSGCAKEAEKSVPPATPAEPVETEKGTEDATGQNVPQNDAQSSGVWVRAIQPLETDTIEEATERAEESAAAEADDAETVATTDAEDQSAEEMSDEEVLGIGDPAPEIAVASWVKGDPVTQFATGQVYVVEFWATWCQPCRASMPHMAELQTSYGDQVQFIGVSDEEASVVEEFMKSEQSEGKTWDDIVTYAMAMDEDGTTNQRYMAAAKQNGIPTAFIVGKDGCLEWIGHPMEIEDPLKQIVDGTWDREKAIQEAIAREEALKRMKELQMKMAEAVQNQDWETAISLLDEVAKDQPAGSPGIALTRATFLRNAGRESEARTVVEEITDKYWEESNMLNAIAWNLAAEMGGVELDLALKMALRADELEGGKNASIHDTVARVYYEKDELDSAIEWQKKAVEGATGSDGNLQDTLQKYEEEKKLRENDDAKAESKDVDESDDEDEEKE